MFIVLIIVQLLNSFYFEDIYGYHIYISRSSHDAIQKATPIVYNTVFCSFIYT